MKDRVFELTRRGELVWAYISLATRARGRNYGVIERSEWMGRGEADELWLPYLHWMSDPAWTGKNEHLPVKANYSLIRENLLDLSKRAS